MPWQAVITLQSILGAVSVLLVRKFAKGGNKYQYAIVMVSFLFEWLLTAALVIALGKFVMPEWSPQLIGLLLLGGFGFGIANFLYFELFSRVPASVGSVQITLNRLAAVLFAFWLLGERLTGAQLIGSALMILAVLVVSYHPSASKHHHLHITKALLVLVGMSTAYAIGTVAEKALLDELGLFTYAVVGWAFQTACVAATVFVRRSKWKMPPKRLHPLMFGYALLFALSGLLFIWTLELSDSSSKTVSASGLKVVLSVIFAYIFLKERKHVAKTFLGAVISVIGLFLLF